MDDRGHIFDLKPGEELPRGAVRLTDSEARYLRTIPTTERKAELARLRQQRVQRQHLARRKRDGEGVKR